MGVRQRPALAYSALTVLVVGVISYLALERSGVPVRQIETLRDTVVASPPAEQAPVPANEPPASGLRGKDAASSVPMKKKEPAAAAAPLKEEKEGVTVGGENALIGRGEMELPARKADRSVPSSSRALEKNLERNAVPAPEAAAPLVAPHFPSAAAAAAPAAMMDAIDDSLFTGAERALIDSFARHDSLKADSVRKALWVKKVRRKP
jgi:hypothetical protein